MARSLLEHSRIIFAVQVISVDPGLQQNWDMKPSVCKIALKVVTKHLKLQDKFKTGKVGTRIQLMSQK